MMIAKNGLNPYFRSHGPERPDIEINASFAQRIVVGLMFLGKPEFRFRGIMSDSGCEA